MAVRLLGFRTGRRLAAAALPAHTFQAAVRASLPVASVAAWVTSRRLVATGASTAKETPAMFCYQCEQTENGTGCSVIGVCGKTPQVAGLQDELIHDVKVLSQWAHRARQAKVPVPKEVDQFTTAALFSTLTNVNFDDTRFNSEFLPKCRELTASLKKAVQAADQGLAKSVQEAPVTGVIARRESLGEETVGLQELITYGLKGVAAYACHAKLLGRENPEVYAEMHRLFSMLGDAGSDSRDSQKLLGAALDVGALNLKVLSMLDEGHTSTFGHPTPAAVATSPVPGKCILVSGHDLHDLEQLLRQTEGLGINVYTHGEMLPAHGYPKLKQFSHLKGNYGGPWNLQKFEFSKFPGPIVMTTNCLIEPRKSYKDRIWTANEVGWPGVKHIPSDKKGNKDFSAVIKQAQNSPGFTADMVAHNPGPEITVGFGHHAILGIADKLLATIGRGDIGHVWVIGGCDGNEMSRSYFRDLAMSTPKNSVILTVGCGKYRFIKSQNEMGKIESLGIPRVLDMGQCNDAYGAVVVAMALAKALNVSINELPLSIALSWFEQKAVAVLLTLLHLGVRDIAIGPNLPAFVGPETLSFLSKNLGLRPTDVEHVDDDVERFLARK